MATSDQRQPRSAVSQKSKRRRDSKDTDGVLEERRPKRPTGGQVGAPTKFSDNTKTSLAQLSPRNIVDNVAKQTTYLSPDLSEIELDEMRIPETSILSTTDWQRNRTENTFSEFLGQYGSSPVAAPREHGAPHTLIVAMSGIRATVLARATRVSQTKEVNVAKLFAKHIKLNEAIKTCKESRMDIGVGTRRIRDLLECGALSPVNLNRIVIDVSYLDSKERGIFDMKDTQKPLLGLLSRKDIRDRYGVAQSPINLLFF